MNYPLISEYVEAIKMAEDNFEELSYLRPVLDDMGQPVMSSGNFAVVFKMRDERDGKLYAVRCFHRDQEGREESYRLIEEDLKDVESSYLVSFRYIDKELFVDSSQTDETEFPVLLMDWVEGITLDKYLRENLDDQYALEMLAYRFSQLAQWLIPQPFAHGDLKPDNILVREDGTLVLVDYDGMYVPAMKGQKARELSSPDFRHPLRTEDDFDEHIDDFPMVSILLSLKAISINSQWLEKYGETDRLLFSERDYRNISDSDVLHEIFENINDDHLRRYMSTFLLVLSDMRLPSSMDDFIAHFPVDIGMSYDDLSNKLKKYIIKAIKGDAKSQNELGYCFYYGDGITQDYSKAIYWYTKSAIQGFRSAQYNMGICYQQGTGVEQNYQKAKEWFEKAAEKGDRDAQYNLGLYYCRGKYGIGVDLKKSFYWFLLSAKQGHPSSQDYSGLYYQYGIGGAEIDSFEAFKWYKQSAEQGNKYGQYHLANCYWYGIGIYVDLKEAIRLFGLAADQGLKIATKEIIKTRKGWRARAAYSEDGETFEGIYAGTEYEIKKGTKYISDGACFDMDWEIDCSHLSKLTIPKSIIYIGDYPFGSHMSEVVCYSPFYEVDNKTLYTKGKKELIQCFNHEVEEFEIPEGVKVIRNYAFYSCQFKRIVIPSSVKEIGINPFVEAGVWGDDMQFYLEIISNSPHYILYKKTLYKDNTIISYWGNGDSLVVPYGIQIIEDDAFRRSNIKKIYLPNSIKWIGKDAFSWCEQLEKIIISYGELQRFKMLLPSTMHNMLCEEITPILNKPTENISDDLPF